MDAGQRFANGLLGLIVGFALIGFAALGIFVFVGVVQTH